MVVDGGLASADSVSWGGDGRGFVSVVMGQFGSVEGAFFAVATADGPAGCCGKNPPGTDSEPYCMLRHSNVPNAYYPSLAHSAAQC